MWKVEPVASSSNWKLSLLVLNFASHTAPPSRDYPAAPHTSSTPPQRAPLPAATRPTPSPHLPLLTAESTATMGAGQSQILEDMEKNSNCAYLSSSLFFGRDEESLNEGS